MNYRISVRLNSGIGPMDFRDGLYHDVVLSVVKAVKEDLELLGLNYKLSGAFSDHDVVDIFFNTKEDLNSYKLFGKLNLKRVKGWYGERQCDAQFYEFAG